MFLGLLILSHTMNRRHEFGCLLCLPADVKCVTSHYSEPASPTSHVVTMMWTLLPPRSMTSFMDDPLSAATKSLQN